MPTQPSLDHRTDRFVTTVKMPVLLKRQVDEFADRMAIPINSAMILLLDRSLRAAGYPGVSGPPPSAIPEPSGFIAITS